MTSSAFYTNWESIGRRINCDAWFLSENGKCVLQITSKTCAITSGLCAMYKKYELNI